jgi:hypothetical protein
MYLQSVKSPPIQQRKLASRKKRPAEEDVFSQTVTDSMLHDDYEDDSFVVDGDEVEYASSTDELDYVMEFDSQRPPSRPKPHHAEGLVNPKVRAQMFFTDFGYPRSSMQIQKTSN